MAVNFPADCSKKNCSHFKYYESGIMEITCHCDLLGMDCDAAGEIVLNCPEIKERKKTMNIEALFKKTLRVKYTHLEEQAASFTYERHGDTLYIFFQKSNGLIDWKNNFNFPAKPYRDMNNKWYAHRGFLRVWKVIEPHLQAAICDLTVEKIVISGYSHGAAIAVLCHEYCKFNRPDILIEGYGFGCPRVVWGFLRKSVKQRFEGFTVIRNGCDIVTHVPPALLGYRHIGKMLKIGQGKKYKPFESHFPTSYSREVRSI